MKDHIALTISDTRGSRYYSIRRTWKAWVLGSLAAVFTVLFSSAAINYFQWRQVQGQEARLTELDREILRFDTENSRLNKVIGENRELISAINDALVEIERDSDLDYGDDPLPLEDRIRLLAVHYNEKDQAYSEIGSRIQQIEGMIGLAGEETEPDGGRTLLSRVELASLTASHKKILHDSIPNGFPTQAETITSKFGMRVHPVSGVKSFHKGVDLRAKIGELVHATADGIVRESGYSKLSGKRIVVQHNFGFETRYSHLESMEVEPGDIVHKGDVLGSSGNTGRTSAPHLHYEIRYLGKAIDPRQFLQWEFGSHEIFTNVRGIKWPSLISLINKQITHQTLQLSQLEPTSSVR